MKVCKSKFHFAVGGERGCIWLKIISLCVSFLNHHEHYCSFRRQSWFSYESYLISDMKNEAPIAGKCDKTSKIIADISVYHKGIFPKIPPFFARLFLISNWILLTQTPKSDGTKLWNTKPALKMLFRSEI